jgi:hypothetical protein
MSSAISSDEGLRSGLLISPSTPPPSRTVRPLSVLNTFLYTPVAVAVVAHGSAVMCVCVCVRKSTLDMIRIAALAIENATERAQYRVQKRHCGHYIVLLYSTL